MIYVKPTSDIFIKYLFGAEENKILLLAFINAVLENSGFPLIRNEDELTSVSGQVFAYSFYSLKNGLLDHTFFSPVRNSFWMVFLSRRILVPY